jgi:RNA polymerase sigma-70 factor (ECF subfamily)
MNYFRRLGVNSEIEDLVQETFLRLFKYRAKYKPTAKFTTFLYMMARQIRIDLLRKQNKQRNIRDELREDGMERLTTQDTTARSNAAIDTRAALVELPEIMRTVVVLNMYHGLKYGDIAKALDIPVGTVKSRMFHALRKLREILDVN